jgi:simple sugar transport system permease protein
MIIAVGACLLMIAGEFDLSVGSMIGFAGMMIAIFSVTLGWPVWQAILITFALCIAIGALNGFIVCAPGCRASSSRWPSCSSCAASPSILPQLIERKTIIGGIDEAAEGDWLAPLFGGKILTGAVHLAGRRRLIAVFERGTRRASRSSTAFRC